MNKMKSIAIIFSIAIIVNFIGCNQAQISYGLNGTDIKFVLPQLKSGDAKLVNNYIITSVNGNMKMIDTEKQKIYDLGIKSNWIDCLLEDDRIIVVYSNSNLQTGICILDYEGNKLQNNIIFNSETLCIDPCIVKNKDTYYLTTTKIKGNINNADINSENGDYTVQLLTSKNLDKWLHISDIVNYKNNIEDVELNFDNERMYFVFEKEIVDKGLSSICLITSNDYGITWENEKQLLASDADHEPAKFIKEDDKWYLYYSSDKGNVGQSYTAGKIYDSIYDERFDVISKDNLINISNPKGTLLYDVKTEKENLELLYSRDYLNENSLILEKVNKSKNIK